MKRVKIGGVLEASAVVMGCMRMASLSVDEAERVIRLAVESGVDYFDHADIYGGGHSEEVFGEVLRRNPGLRDKILIQDKVGIRKGYYDASAKHIVEATEGCLKRLGVDSIDALLLHRPDALMEPEEVAEAYTKLQKEGKVRFFGVSNENPGQMELLQSSLPMKLIANQMQFGPAHTIMVDEGINVNNHSSHATQFGGDTLNWCRLHKVTIQTWSPLQYGMIAGPFMTNPDYAPLTECIKSMAERKGVSMEALTTAWILRHPANFQVIIGSMNADRLKTLYAGADCEVTREEWYEIYRAAGNPIP